MADPHHQEQLDGLDRISVFGYRFGWCCLSLALWNAAWGLLSKGQAPLFWSFAPALCLLSLNLHLYNKLIRYLIQHAAGLTLLLTLAYYLSHWPWLYPAILGLSYAVFSAFAYKESFCFQFGWLKYLALVYALDWLAELVGLASLQGFSSLVLAVAVSYITLLKLRQPLHFDIGDKSKYQH